MSPLINSTVNKYKGVPIPRSAVETEARRLAAASFDTYDPNRGAALGTHMVNGMKHLQRYVIKYQNIGSIPEHRAIGISNFKQQKDLLTTDLGREPTTLEMSDALVWSPKEVERMSNEIRSDLNINTGDEGDSGFFDASFNTSDKTKEILYFIYHSPNSNDTTKKIIEYSFGFGGNTVINTPEIARKLNLPESEVRKIRSNIAKKVFESERLF